MSGKLSDIFSKSDTVNTKMASPKNGIVASPLSEDKLTSGDKDTKHAGPQKVTLISNDVKSEGHVLSVAIIVDDGGSSIQLAQEVAELKIPTTWAVIPYMSHSKETAELASQHGIPLLLHLPMQAITDKDGNGQYLVGRGMSAEEIRRVTVKALDTIPSAIGLNNHRGSLSTADSKIIKPVLEELKSRDLMFVDSRTIGKSIAYRDAKKAKIKALKNNGFLDNIAEVWAIEAQFKTFVRSAAKNRSMILICHFRPDTVKFLKKLSNEMNGIPARFVTIPEMFEIQSENNLVE
ncbi:MAG: divergent polysaccharide deacetylase family protein [Synergistaceae bacterium]|nr:divergent polysaccharide deacetylase family protein [Synergistaceae bacterium]